MVGLDLQAFLKVFPVLPQLLPYVHPEACQQPPQLLLLLQSQRRQPPLPLPPAHRFQQPCSRRKV